MDPCIYGNLVQRGTYSVVIRSTPCRITQHGFKSWPQPGPSLCCGTSCGMQVRMCFALIHAQPGIVGELIFMGPPLTSDEWESRDKFFSPTFAVYLVLVPEYLVKFLRRSRELGNGCP